MTKYKAGEQFIIEIGEVSILKDGTPRYHIKGFKSLVFDDYGLNLLAKHSEYEIGKMAVEIKKRAYKEGYDRGRECARINDKLIMENEQLRAKYAELLLANDRLDTACKERQDRLAKIWELVKGDTK